MKETRILWILTRTPMHVGAGASVGVIDMPIQRERHTQIPIVPGSGLKGVLRDLWDKKKPDEAMEQDRLFGPESRGDQDARAGELIVGEARTVCFPVRSAKGSFAWLTSPLALARLARERGKSLPPMPIADDHCRAGKEITIANEDKGQVVIEEYCLAYDGQPAGEVIDLLKDAFKVDPVWETLESRLVIVSDGIFSHFCANACEVQQRIRINDDTGTVDGSGLFNQENLPSETLLYAVIGERRPDAVNALAKRLESELVGNIIQLGGDETIGLGYCSVRMEGGN